MPIEFGKLLSNLQQIDEELKSVQAEISERKELPSAVDLVMKADLLKNMGNEVELKLAKVKFGLSDEPMTKKHDKNMLKRDRINDVNNMDERIEEEEEIKRRR